MRRTLAQWLQWQEGLHPRAIDMGLERVREVAQRMGLLPFPAYCISIAGTNGKGSSALMLGHLLGPEHYPDARVGVYTSPYLVRYNERVSINGVEASDAELCVAFEAVETARENTSLTYFEFGTLAALWLFKQANVDYAILEVGMGGRLDAVNVVDANAALITSIGLDHVDWLGDTTESIAREKAGIFRDQQMAICAQHQPPASLLETASDKGTQLRCIGEDFDLWEEGGTWHWRDWDDKRIELPICPHLLPDNVAGVLALLTAIDRFPSKLTLQRSLPAYSVPGRRQCISGPIPVVLDVAHNLQAMQTLIDWLRTNPPASNNSSGSEHIVIGMLANKPVEAVGALLANAGKIYAGGLTQIDRGLSGPALAQRLNVPAEVHDTVSTAFQAAKAQAKLGDRIVVCGSFYSVNAVLGEVSAHSSTAKEKQGGG